LEDFSSLNSCFLNAKVAKNSTQKNNKEMCLFGQKLAPFGKKLALKNREWF